MWTRPPYRKPGADIESGAPPLLYPMMLEPPELRWAFIRKIYSIIAIQMLLSVAVSAVVVTVHPISHFFVSSGAGLGIYILLIFLPFIVMIPMYYYHQSYPVNLLLLGLFTVSISFVVGLTCAFTRDNNCKYQSRYDRDCGVWFHCVPNSCNGDCISQGDEVQFRHTVVSARRYELQMRPTLGPMLRVPEA